MAFGVVLVPAAVNAQSDCSIDASNPLSGGSNCTKNESQPANLAGENGVFKTITNVLLFIIGAVSVIMIIYGGITYVTSAGDSTRVQNAKNTILYAVVGLIVAILAFAVVNFVITSFTTN
jgi:multisubunit Na+/H+ antiporter MnhB subunit